MATINRQGAEREEVCTVCGKKFIARGHAKYCSRKCRDRTKTKAYRVGDTMSALNADYSAKYKGCIGCTDFALSEKTCDYLLNNGHCRPCRINEGGGCAVRSRKNRIGNTRNGMRTWSTQDAARLLAEGKSVRAAARELDANTNSVKEWLAWGDQDKAVRRNCPEPPPEKLPRGQPVKFTDEQFLALYERGMADAEIAEQVGSAVVTVKKRRQKLRLPANRRRKMA